jgi:(p)ppGpp synthase/HD superfamily hydrolase
LVYPLNDGDDINLHISQTEVEYPVKYLSYLQTKVAKKNFKKLFNNKSEQKRAVL